MRLIPAIDILGGQCVRLQQGDYQRARSYSDDPLAMAQQFEAAGLQYLHVVDLDGARAGRVINEAVLRRIGRETRLTIDFGGGVKTRADLEKVLDCGVEQVTLGSLAARQPEVVREWLQDYGPERFILGADFKAGRIATQGWTQQSDWELEAFIEAYLPMGLRRVIPTDVSRDGTLTGPAVETYRRLLEHHPLELIASGGIRNAAHLEVLKDLGCYGAIVGKAFYEGHLSLATLARLQAQFLKS